MVVRRRKLQPRRPRTSGNGVYSAVNGGRSTQWPAVIVAGATVAAVVLVGAMFRARGDDHASKRYVSAMAEAPNVERGSAITTSEAKREPVLKDAFVRQAHAVEEYDHDLGAFTQGLVWHDGFLYESTGLYGRSSVRRIDLSTSKIEDMHHLPNRDFGEGCTVVDGDLIQVVWKTGEGYVYSLPHLEKKHRVRFDGDGWGITSDRQDAGLLYLSDGTDTIRAMRIVREGSREGKDDTVVELQEQRRFVVRDGATGKKVSLLNELEMVNDELWANIWFSNLVARIDVSTGIVTGWIDMQNVLDYKSIPTGHRVDVLNGIAYDADSDAIYVTGKLWPRFYRIRIGDIVAPSIAGFNTFFTDPSKVQEIMSHTI